MLKQEHRFEKPLIGGIACSWQTQMDAAFAALLSAVRTLVQTKQLALRPVVITYIGDAPPTIPPDAPQMDMPSLWQSPVHIQLAFLLEKAGFSSITHIPLYADQPIPEQTASMKAQLSELNDPQVLVLCTPTYADCAQDEGSALNHMLSAFGAGKQDNLMPLMVAGGFAHAARIVPSHFLFRDWEPALAAFNGRTGGMPALIDLFCPLSGNNGLGLLPDLLDLSNDRNAAHAPQYASLFADLERIQARVTADDILSQDLERQCMQHALYPHLKDLPTPRLNPNHKGKNADLPPDLNGLVQQVLEQPAIKTALLLGASAVDMETFYS